MKVPSWLKNRFAIATGMLSVSMAFSSYQLKQAGPDLAEIFRDLRASLADARAIAEDVKSTVDTVATTAPELYAVSQNLAYTAEVLQDPLMRIAYGIERLNELGWDVNGKTDPRLLTPETLELAAKAFGEGVGSQDIDPEKVEQFLRAVEELARRLGIAAEAMGGRIYQVQPRPVRPPAQQPPPPALPQVQRLAAE